MKKILIGLTFLASVTTFASKIEMSQLVNEGVSQISYSSDDVRSFNRAMLIGRKSTDRLVHIEARIDSEIPSFDQRLKVISIKNDYIKRGGYSLDQCHMYFVFPTMKSQTKMTVGLQIFVENDPSKSDREMIEIGRLCAQKVLSAGETVINYTFSLTSKEK